MKSNRGFTLLEVLISVGILAILGTLAARTVQQGLRAKVKVQGQIDQVSKMRDALRLMERDINLAFHYRDIQKELEAITKKLKQPGAAPVPGAQPTQPAIIPTDNEIPQEAPRPTIETQWAGTEDSLHFVTMSNARTVRDSRQADFIEVGYSYRDCRSVDGTRSSKCLWRRTSAIVDDDVARGGDEVPLLENVTEFSLQYLGKGKQDWVKAWRSGEGADTATKGNFPLAVQISLTVEENEKGKKKKYSMQIVASVHFPNNKEDDRGTTAAPMGGTQ